jgi:hypothetical protein
MLSIRLQSGDAENAWFEVASGLVLKITHGSATASTVSGVSADTDYNVWVHYKKGTGSNGEMSVGFSTGTTEPTSGDNYASLTNGTSTNQTDRWQWRNNTATTTRSYYFDSMIVDDVIVDDAAIGDF